MEDIEEKIANLDKKIRHKYSVAIFPESLRLPGRKYCHR